MITVIGSLKGGSGKSTVARMLSERLGDILAFPEYPGSAQYLGPTLFLYGTESDYLRPSAEPAIRALFPYARLRPVTGAGHWVYSEQPQLFTDILIGFLDKAFA